MSSKPENVHSLDEYKSEDVSPNYDAAVQEVMENANSDFGKLGMFIAILSAILAVVLFYGVHQQVGGLTTEVNKLTSLRGEIAVVKTEMANIGTTIATVDGKVAAVDGRVDAVDGKVAGVQEQVVAVEKKLADIPNQMKQALVADALNDMAQKLGYMKGEISEAEAAKLQEAMKLLQDVQGSLK